MESRHPLKKRLSSPALPRAPHWRVCTIHNELVREVRTVEFDPDQAPLTEWAFKAFASGN